MKRYASVLQTWNRFHDSGTHYTENFDLIFSQMVLHHISDVDI